MKTIIILLLVTFSLFLYKYPYSLDANDNNDGLDTLTKIINLNWNVRVEDIRNNYPLGIYSSTDETNRIIGHYIVNTVLFNHNSKVVFYDFDENRAWGNIPMRRVYIDIEDEKEGEELSNKIISYIHDNYTNKLIFPKNNTNMDNNKYNLHIYGYFDTERGLDVRISQMKSSFGSRHLQILLVPVIHTKEEVE